MQQTKHGLPDNPRARERKNNRRRRSQQKDNLQERFVGNLLTSPECSNDYSFGKSVPTKISYINIEHINFKTL